MDFFQVRERYKTVVLQISLLLSCREGVIDEDSSSFSGADAPVTDAEGNKTMVRFSRKTKQQYVSSEKDGKATGWSAFYIDGKWVEGKK